MKLITNAEYDAMEEIEPGLGERMLKLQEQNTLLKMDVEVLQNILVGIFVEIFLDE